MGTLDDILQHKPLSEWQAAVKSRGILCPECSTPCAITAPVHSSEGMLRVHCENCGHLHFEFKPAGEVVPFPAAKGDCQ